MKFASSIRSRTLPGRKKWWIVGAIIGTIVIFGILVVVLSNQFWKDFTDQHATAYRTYKGNVDAALNADPKDVMTKLKSVSQSSPDNTRCDVPIVLQWQTTVIDDLRQKVELCQSDGVKILKMNDTIQSTIAYFEATTNISSALKPVVATEIDESKLSDIAKAWTAAADTTKGAAVPTPLRAAKESLVVALQNTAKAWSSLAEANAAKDRIKYEAAAAQVTKAYDELALTAANSQKSTQLVTAELEKEYKAAF